ncbi:carbamoyltransferase HypF [Nocardia sp. NPDC056000]|uniref:carbamoyltransferase HypF n=1 Tax=Nocardia sp. NPDC056000 TaxID=3345674 RepID=UPI0035DD6932
MTRARRRLLVAGVVQGVGFRPFVYTTAAELALSGSVSNDSAGVIIEVEGAPADLDEFARRVREQPPPLAVVESVRENDIAVRGGTGFHIGDTSRTGGGRTLASPDVAMCADCARELQDPGNRRYRHPFINCTNCGPRFTIIASLPYDRDRTSMADFVMCERCAAEYADPTDRRFHAQPIACPDCGPTLMFVARSSSAAVPETVSRTVPAPDPGGVPAPGSGAARARHRGPVDHTLPGSSPSGAAALRQARELLRAGGILAVKGIGGYHLACDAADETAVAELRRRKRRGDKPFAVMVPDLATARSIVEVDDSSAALLSGPQRPIVLLARKDRALAASVAPRNPDLGVMIAYTPLHVLLFGCAGDDPGPRVLVMTSGNLGGEPICYDDADARTRLAELADGWLSHDRRILVPCDDSVVRMVDGTELPIRRSRGYAPLPVALPFAVPPTLAVGGDLKNTCAVADGRYAWLSQHIGDMDDLDTLRAFDDAERHLEELTGVRPEHLAADAHPLYRSTAWARQRAGNRPVRTVQHHHAHIAAVMGEHGLGESATVVGFAFDGTGFGPDGAVWGGEVLLTGYKGFRRLAHLAYVPLAGGDVSVQRPYRMALAHLWAAGIEWSADIPAVAACPPRERRVLAHQFATGLGCVPTSSMGRLFDAVSALAGVRHIADYEAQAAIELEGLARVVDSAVSPDISGYRFGIDRAADPIAIDPAPVLAAVVADAVASVDPGLIGARFHRAVAHLVLELAIICAGESRTVALSGGVFQNALLLSQSRALLEENGFHVLSHRRLPPNDGGLAFGQILAASAG